MTYTEGLRKFAKNMRLLSDIAGTNADHSPDKKEADAWIEASSRLLTVAYNLFNAADDIDGLWELPLEEAA